MALYRLLEDSLDIGPWMGSDIKTPKKKSPIYIFSWLVRLEMICGNVVMTYLINMYVNCKYLDS